MIITTCCFEYEFHGMNGNNIKPITIPAMTTALINPICI